MAAAWRGVRQEGEESRGGKGGMEREAAGAHLPTPWLLRRRNALTIEPITAWAALTYSSANTRYSFLDVSGL